MLGAVEGGGCGLSDWDGMKAVIIERCKIVVVRAGDVWIVLFCAFC